VSPMIIVKGKIVFPLTLKFGSDHAECLSPKLAERETITLSLRTTTPRLRDSAPLREVFAKNLFGKIHAEAHRTFGSQTQRMLFEPFFLFEIFVPLCSLCENTLE